MIRVAMLSKWHVHAGDYANQVKASGVAAITCVWDDDAERGAAWAAELGVPFDLRWMRFWADPMWMPLSSTHPLPITPV